MAAELWAFREGLALALNLNIRKFYIELDAKSAICLITSHYPMIDDSHPCSALIYDCRSLLQNFVEVYINHIYGEGNHCVDLLAKEWNLRAFAMVKLNFFAFNISKTHSIYFNTPLYNTTNINGSIFFNTSFKYSLFIFILSLIFIPFSLFLFVSLSSLKK